MPMAPPRACTTCGVAGCQVHRRPAWQRPHRVARRRGRQLQQWRNALFRRQPFCAACGLEVATTRDHIVPLGDGGLDVETNTQALCVTCHAAKTAAEAKRRSPRVASDGD